MVFNFYVTAIWRSNAGNKYADISMYS